MVNFALTRKTASRRSHRAAVCRSERACSEPLPLLILAAPGRYGERSNIPGHEANRVKELYEQDQVACVCRDA